MRGIGRQREKENKIDKQANERTNGQCQLLHSFNTCECFCLSSSSLGNCGWDLIGDGMEGLLSGFDLGRVVRYNKGGGNEDKERASMKERGLSYLY